MLTYISRRLLQSIAILFGLSIFFFFLLHESPGGPCDAFSAAGPAGCGARYHACVVRLGLNDPLPGQYLKWLSHLLHGDLGVSNVDGIPSGMPSPRASPPPYSSRASPIWSPS